MEQAANLSQAREVKTLIVTARAIYKDGRLVFYDSEEIPEDGTEVILHFERQLKSSGSSCRSGKRGSLKGIWKGSIIDENLFSEARKSLFNYEDE